MRLYFTQLIGRTRKKINKSHINTRALCMYVSCTVDVVQSNQTRQTGTFRNMCAREKLRFIYFRGGAGSRHWLATRVKRISNINIISLNYDNNNCRVAVSVFVARFVAMNSRRVPDCETCTHCVQRYCALSVRALVYRKTKVSHKSITINTFIRDCFYFHVADVNFSWKYSECSE